MSVLPGYRRQGRLFVLSAPSGAGKTTLVHRLLRRMPRLQRSISMTTRRPRPGERTGRDYYFVARPRFAVVRRRNALLECARVHGEWYGTPSGPVRRALRAGRDVLLCIDVQGARQVVRRWPACVRIFVLPPSLASLRRRLEHRRTEDPAQIRARLVLARRELQAAPSYNYLVVNDELRQAVDQLQAIVIAERCRVPHRTR